MSFPPRYRGWIHASPACAIRDKTAAFARPASRRGHADLQLPAHCPPYSTASLLGHLHPNSRTLVQKHLPIKIPILRITFGASISFGTEEEPADRRLPLAPLLRIALLPAPLRIAAAQWFIQVASVIQFIGTAEAQTRPESRVAPAPRSGGDDVTPGSEAGCRCAAGLDSMLDGAGGSGGLSHFRIRPRRRLELDGLQLPRRTHKRFFGNRHCRLSRS